MVVSFDLQEQKHLQRDSLRKLVNCRMMVRSRTGSGYAIVDSSEAA